VDPSYLVGARESPTLAGPRLVGAAMLVGMVLATLSSPRQAGECVKAFFDGTGYAYTHVISLIVAATTFGKAAEVVGIQRDLHALIDMAPSILIPLAVAVSLLFAWVCGSGIAASQSLFPFFIEPARKLDVDPVNLGALTSLASAGGRTMSPVAAVTLICSSLTQTQPMDLVRRVAIPIVVGMAVVTLLRWVAM
jgi:DcuC family C4-dicarboxylate transporter